ncbi:hypothetical protein ACHAWT_007759, partial [Skeletonema menzelii]
MHTSHQLHDICCVYLFMSSHHKNLNNSLNKIKLSNMIRTLLIACLPATLIAFSTHPKIMTRQSVTAVYYHPDVFEKAVDCAQNYGMCNVDELLNLAEELEQYNGCYYEDGAEACQKEIDDRHDLADLLLLQTELQQRDHYLNEG